MDKQDGHALRGSIQFVPSRELTEARQLLDLATSSGHKMITLRPEDLESYFTVMEAEEKKVFDLQRSTGELALRAANAEEQVAQLRELYQEHKRIAGAAARVIEGGELTSGALYSRLRDRLIAAGYLDEEAGA